jgi:YMGG-like Gly-zipper
MSGGVTFELMNLGGMSMRIMCKTFGAALLLALITSPVLAQRQYRDSDTTMRTLIRRVETRSDTFSNTLQTALDRSRWNNTAQEDEVNRLVTDFEYATDQLKTRFDSRQSTSADARTVLEKAALIDSFLSNNRLENRVDQDWRLLQSDLDLLARSYYITDWRWNAGGMGTGTGTGTGVGYRLTDAQMRQLTQRIDTRTDRFGRSLRSALNRSRINNGTKDEATRNLTALESATNQLMSRVNTRQYTESDARSVLEPASYLNSLMANNVFSTAAERDWTMLWQDLDQLVNASNIAWNWNNLSTPGGPIYSADGELTGTYRLDSSRSADVRQSATNATRNLPAAQRQRVYDSLIRRLDSPETLAIERRGNTITIASSQASRISFVADGREHVETTPNGRTVRVKASFSGDQLTVTRTGDRAQDFTVTFDPSDSGRRLTVTRRLYSDQFSQPVTALSYYDRTSDVAQLDMNNGSQSYPTTGTTSGEFMVPNGTQLVAVLNSNLSTTTARDNERFTMTVRSPSQYDGATIEGYVTNVNRSGRITGRSEMTLNFDTIRMRDGRNYRFAGIVETVRTPGNETVQVDNEGAVREDDQTGKTIQRTAIGTAVGAIIGAIAGGGKGAAIGAAVGAGAGAGSVYVQGRDDLELTTGTEVTVRASAPR